MNRPQSVTIVAILQLLSGIFSLFDGLVILFFAGLFGGIGAAIGAAKVGTVIGRAIALFAAISLYFSRGDRFSISHHQRNAIALP
jgi:hypothetical protein